MCKKIKKCSCDRDHKKKCCTSIKANINALSLTTTSITTLNLTKECHHMIDSSCVIIGSNSIIFNNVGMYDIKGYIDLVNQSTAITNFAVIAGLITTTSTINPNSITYSGVKINTPFSGLFNFTIQVVVPNTAIQLNVRSTSNPTIISGGKIKIKKI